MSDTRTQTGSSTLISMNGQNPFSLETIRARKEEQFPAIPVDPFTKREKKIVAQGREEVLPIGLTGLKGRDN